MKTTTEAELVSIAETELDLPKVLDDVARHCVTFMGADAVRALQPHSSVEALRAEVQRVQECVNLIAAGETIPYDRIADVRPLLQRSVIAGNFLSASDLLSIQETMAVSRQVRRYFLEREGLAPNIAELCATLVDDRVVEKHIVDAIDETGAVRDSASKELQSIRRDIVELSARLRSRLQKILRKFGEDEVLQDEFITQRDGRFVLPVRVENKRTIAGIIHGMSQTGSTVFMEPAETFDMNNDLSLLHGREQREVIRILTTLTAEVAAVSSSISAAFDVLLNLDTTLARARHALENGGLQPTILEDETIELVDVRHPVLVAQARTSRFDVVPLRVEFTDSVRGILISGPNAGGKTVAMKTIGVSLAMAQCGVFPLGTVRTGLRRIFTAIGDHQSIDSNLSTFSSQIIRIRDILSWCGRDAVVLIDEICAGTDPAEGGALASGILDSLIERGACFVVTTHQSSLKQYALTRPTIANASLAFDDERLQPTFRFLPGVPGNSYAFVLAKNVGLPDVVLTRARTYLGDRHDELEESIAAMQRFRNEAESAFRETAQERAAAEKIRRDYEQRLADVRKKRATIVDDARAEASEILRKANALIENTIREIREQERSAAESKKRFQEGVRDVIEPAHDEERAPSAPLPTSGTDLNRPIQVGDNVAVTGTQNSGTVVEIDKKTGAVTVDVNGIRFKFKQAQLEVTTATPKPRKSDGIFVKFDARTSIDLRGMRADEGLKALESFLSDAILGGIGFGTIVHGKGTGALRKVVHDYLHEHPHIKSWRSGALDEGGDGVTVVEFS